VSIKQIEVFAPASIANLGPGFDVFGLAIEGLGDTVKLSKIEGEEIIITVDGVPPGSIPLEPRANSSGAVVKAAMEKETPGLGFKINILKGVQPGIGLGSSGASAAATAFAVNLLLSLELSRDELVRLAALGEAAVAGSPHADNVSASLLGGFTIVSGGFNVVRLDPPDVNIVVVTPDVQYENKTKLARSLLPANVPFGDAVRNMGSVSKMVAGVCLNDAKLFGEAVDDHIVERYRAEMIPNFWGVKRAALGAGAHGCSIAGGGPSLFAVGDRVDEIGSAMTKAFEEVGVGSDVFFTKPSGKGARVV
jgi:homoserine kinase